MITNKHVARALKLTSDLIELTGGNAFRGRAYASAARAVEQLDTSVVQLAAEGSLAEVRGIGKGLAADLEALARGEPFAPLDALLTAVPPGVLDVLRVRGLGPKKVRVLWEELDVTSLDDLEAAAVAGRIAALSGFGAKTEQKILAEIERLREALGRRHYATAQTAVEPVLDRLCAAEGVLRAEPTGALRRACDTLDRAELLVAGDAESLRAALADFEVDEPLDVPNALFVGALPDGLPLVVYHAAAPDFGRALWRTTGSVAHREAFVAAHGEPDAAENEAAVFERVGLAPVPPELREDDDLSPPPDDLVTQAHLRGVLHNHSTYSDGAHTLSEMAEAARERGYAYFGIADHSRSLQIAHGLSIDDVRRQGEEVRRLNADYQARGIDFRIFHGSEVDILSDGAMDYPNDVLAELDYVVASIHLGFNMTEAEATERIERAVSNPYVDILGHPTGRLLLRRPGYPINHEAIIAACARHGVAIELNANPWRLDVDWRFVRAATEAGVRIAINPDAHTTDGLDDVRWGLVAARKGRLRAAHCLNALSPDAFAAWLHDRRRVAERTV